MVIYSSPLTLFSHQETLHALVHFFNIIFSNFIYKECYGIV